MSNSELKGLAVNRFGYAVVVLLINTLLYADEPVPFVIQSAEDKFASAASTAEAAVAKAEAEAAKARKAAAEIRLKAYKDRLAEVTKTGDFDKAIAVKARIEQLEKDSETAMEKTDNGGSKPKRPRPKDAVKFGGHWYALINDKAPWHVAKRRCEDMGGHLVTIDTPAERIFVESLCTATEWTWAGGTDEIDEGHWVWINGKPITTTDWIEMDLSDEQHYLGFNRITKKWYDCNEEHRTNYVCEWDR